MGRHFIVDRSEERFKQVPSARVGNIILMRGTNEWEEREIARHKAGCSALSFGTVTESNRTNGNSALRPM